MKWLFSLVVPVVGMVLCLVACRGPAGEGTCLDMPAGCVPEPVCADTCVQVAPAGFTGPSLFWIGPAAEAASCPEIAPIAGITAFDDTTPAVEPPCAQTKEFSWGVVARECLITPGGGCSVQGEICVPGAPAGFELCIYQDDASYCPASYPEARTLLRDSPDAACAIRGVELVTLCCAPSGGPA